MFCCVVFLLLVLVFFLCPAFNETAAETNSVLPFTGGASKESLLFPQCNSRKLLPLGIRCSLRLSVLSIKAYDSPA